MADKIFRIVEEDVNDDGQKDLTIKHADQPIVTLYNWRTAAIGWIATTTSLFVAGFGLLSIF